MTPPQPNVALVEQVLGQIDAHPETWNQEKFAQKTERGTSYCFATWACVLSGDKIFWEEDSPTASLVASHIDNEDFTLIEDRAQDLLGLGIIEAARLFDPRNTRDELQELVDQIIARSEAPR